MPIPPEVGPPAMTADELAALDDLAQQALEQGYSPAEAVLHPDQLGSPVDGPGPQAEVLQRWRITDDRAAEWAMRMLALAVEQVGMAEAAAAGWRDDVDTWLAATTAKPHATVAFMRHHLEDYAIRHRQETGRATLTLPSGKVSTRPTPDRIIVVDPEQVLAWAGSWGEAILDQVAPPKRTPLVSVIKDMVRRADGTEHTLVDAAGEVVPGLRAEPGAISATVKPA